MVRDSCKFAVLSLSAFEVRRCVSWPSGGISIETGFACPSLSVVLSVGAITAPPPGTFRFDFDPKCSIPLRLRELGDLKWRRFAGA